MTTDCIVYDIDGTLADASHRRHFVGGEKKDWQQFLKASAEDKLVQSAADMWAEHVREGYVIIVMSGRPAWLAETTRLWLAKHGLHPEKQLMRDNKDRSPDANIKRYYLHQLRRQGYNVLMAVDSRKEAAAMWKEEGIPVVALDPECQF